MSITQLFLVLAHCSIAVLCFCQCSGSSDGGSRTTVSLLQRLLLAGLHCPFPLSRPKSRTPCAAGTDGIWSPCRMIPAASKSFFLTDLIAGRDYDLCVLAVYEDGVTSLTATTVVGCVQFTTEEEYRQCRSLHAQFLGGTMIIIIGGIIVASVLVFIFILLMKYKVYANHHKNKNTKVNNVCSQTNGSQRGSMAHSSSKLLEAHVSLHQECSGMPVKGRTVRDREGEKPAPTDTAALRNETLFQ